MVWTPQLVGRVGRMSVGGGVLTAAPVKKKNGSLKCSHSVPSHLVTVISPAKGPWQVRWGERFWVEQSALECPDGAQCNHKGHFQRGSWEWQGQRRRCEIDIDVEQCGSRRQVTRAVSTSLKRQGYRSSIEFTEVARPSWHCDAVPGKPPSTSALGAGRQHVCVAFGLEPFSSRRQQQILLISVCQAL